MLSKFCITELQLQPNKCVLMSQHGILFVLSEAFADTGGDGELGGNCSRSITAGRTQPTAGLRWFRESIVVLLCLLVGAGNLSTAKLFCRRILIFISRSRSPDPGSYFPPTVIRLLTRLC